MPFKVIVPRNRSASWRAVRAVTMSSDTVSHSEGFSWTTFAVRSAWDQIRNRNDPSTFPNWHFVDYPLIAPSFPDRGSPTPQDDILFGNDQSETILRGSSATAQDKAVIRPHQEPCQSRPRRE